MHADKGRLVYSIKIHFARSMSNSRVGSMYNLISLPNPPLIPYMSRRGGGGGGGGVGLQLPLTGA